MKRVDSPAFCEKKLIGVNEKKISFRSFRHSRKEQASVSANDGRTDAMNTENLAWISDDTFSR